MLSVSVEMIGLASLTAAAWLRFGLWAGLLVAGVALLLVANFVLTGPRRKRTRLVRIPSSALTNDAVDALTPESVLTNGAVDRD